MKGGTLFSGIGAAELAAPEIDWRWCAEIDPFACAVLAERFPAVCNLGDVNRIEPDAIEPVDIIVYGSPCQSFSVAGKRLGLADDRGNLALVALGLIGRIRPRWLVLENVPGLLSSGGGRDFGAILGALAKLGYGFAYRILDAQFSEFHSAAAASSLSDVLETGALPPRYFLSATACAGILRRAAKRGKVLPPFLKAALQQAVQAGEPIF